MIQSNVFDYVNVLDKAADASWKRQELISNNIANQDTPGYKRQDVEFETLLRQQLRNSKYQTIDDKVGNVDLSRLNARQYTDYGDFSYRLDENNVDPEQEQVKLAANQMKYEGLMNSLTQEFQNLQSVMK
ncbi:MAG: flagellar basal body rod protein FlgB [Lachnospiraceae bacterium]|nr:flagellar basal body rod protein FlgB [Lachnospiraceae bacterium]